MTLREDLERTISLQNQYSSSNTPEMQERGIHIRNGIPGHLRGIRHKISDATGVALSDLLIEGRDATGLKAEVPWVRLASRTRSPRATAGWYVVLLFRKDGAGVYLALAHGSTHFSGGSFVSRSSSELADLMSWARQRLPSELNDREDLTSSVTLAARRGLGQAYEKSCVFALFYAAGKVPDDQSIHSDLLMMGSLLGQLYLAENLGQSPLSENPEVMAARLAIEQIAKPNASPQQGFSLTSAERKAVEIQAMKLAVELLSSFGYTSKDVSLTSSFDLLATKPDAQIKVEVKGTTGAARSILLTANEVELHRNESPQNALIVVHDINLQRTNNGPVCSGGRVKYWIPWHVEDSQLTPTAYSYKLI